MASVVSICNNAIIRVGGKTITSLNDLTNEAKSCRTLYEDVRNAVFREHPFNCIVGRKSLNELATTPDFGFAHQYQLPTDCLRVLSLNDDTHPLIRNGLYDLGLSDQKRFHIEGRLLLTDEGEANIRYVKKVEDPNQYDPLLLDAIASRLAAEIAFPITRNAQLVTSMWNSYYTKFSIARSSDGMEGTIDGFESNEIGGVR
jgi:hypothetical protein